MDDKLKKNSEFSPNLPLLKAVRHSNSATLSDLCAIAGLDPSSDFKQLSASDLDFRGSELESFVISSDLPDHVTAKQMEEHALQLSSPIPELSDEVGFKSFLSSVAGAVNSANAAYQRDGRISGLSTGFYDLDKKIGGLHQADLVVLAAAPSMGKTAFATQIAFNVARATQSKQKEHQYGAGGKVGYFSLQLKAEQLAQRILAIESEIPVVDLQRGDMTEVEFRRYVDAAKTLESIPLFIDDTFGSVEALASRAEKLKVEMGLDLLVVDMIDDMSESRANSQKNAVEIEGILKVLKRLAKEENVCVLVTADLGKVFAKRKDKRPKASDLAEIGAINQFADTVLFLHREEYYVEQQKPDDYDIDALAQWQDQMERIHGAAEVTVAKQRNGSIGVVELSFDGRFTSFGNLTKPWQQSDSEF